ncbi:MAG: DUF3445 domain-containing protein [Devosia sp.]
MHTPYDGSYKLFQIGVKLLDPAEWLDVDARLPDYLDEKARLGAERFGEVFAAEPGTEAAQREVLDLLVPHMLERFPDVYRREGDGIAVAGRHVSLAAEPALWTAASLVQDDLVLMRRDENGWRLAAGALCFASSWRLADKIGRVMHEVHAPVPGFGAGTRPAELIARMFDSMRPETPMLRWNWSVYGDGELHHPHESPPRRFGMGERAETLFLRVERQTLRKLPVGGDILFAIRIYVDPIAALEAHPDAARIAAALIAQLSELSEAQLEYKGLLVERARLVSRLAEIAA